MLVNELKQRKKKIIPRETTIEPIQITFTDMIIVPHLKVIPSFIVQLVPMIK